MVEGRKVGRGVKREKERWKEGLRNEKEREERKRGL